MSQTWPKLAIPFRLPNDRVAPLPIILGRGRTMFEGVQERLPLKLTKTRAFGNGNVLLCYKPRA